MKRLLSQEEEEVISKNLKMARLESASNQDNLLVASGLEVSTAFARHFNYEFSDKRAKSNLLKAAARDAFEILERKTCTMLQFNVGSYLEMVLPTVGVWKNGERKITIQDMEIQIDDVIPGYDENNKHMETLVRFSVNGEKIVFICYNSTQRIKVEGRGYLKFMQKFIQPFFEDRLRKIDHVKLDRYNKDVIAALSGKRKAISRPMRSVKYKAMAKLPCNKCDTSFMNTTHLNRHKRTMHTKGMDDSSGSIRNIPIVDDLSLLDITSDDIARDRTKP